ncbi:MAG: hypothetical protein AUK49_02520 [Betaproteobacteria bacterium CG2_30_68_42]|nr:MAG: hypothetical protein AUK49_02520 [Betaproteobacteria bacterium CG2_30_68_42]
MVESPPARERGFTYLGALLLVALMGAALAAVGEAWTTSVRRDREEQLLFVGGEFRRAIERYYAASPAGAGSYPRELEELLHDRRDPAIRRHLRKIYLDPLTGKAAWELVRGPQGELLGVNSLFDGMPMKRSGFAAEDVAFENAESYRDWQFVYASPRSTPGAHTSRVPAAEALRR